MKVLRVTLRLAAGAVVLLGAIVIISIPAYRLGLNARCRIGNATGARFTSKAVKLEHQMNVDWARRALTCNMGEYEVSTPRDAGTGEGTFILRKGRPFILVTDKETAILDETGERLLYSFTRATEVPAISYSAYDSKSGRSIENFDFGADGSLDYRTTTVKGKDQKREFLVGGQWLEFVSRDGRGGVVFDGRFMPVADAITLADSTARK